MMKVKDKVKELLINNPSNRDCDSKLIANYWYYELLKNNINLKNLNAFDLLKYFSNNNLTNVKTIIRMRSKLQEEYYELRGKKYKLRQTTLKNKVRKELGYEAY